MNIRVLAIWVFSAVLLVVASIGGTIVALKNPRVRAMVFESAADAGQGAAESPAERNHSALSESGHDDPEEHADTNGAAPGPRATTPTQPSSDRLNAAEVEQERNRRSSEGEDAPVFLASARPVVPSGGGGADEVQGNGTTGAGSGNHASGSGDGQGEQGSAAPASEENGRASPRPASVDYVALREDIDEVSNALESFNSKLRRLMIGEQERTPETTEGEDANREGADSSTDTQTDEAGTTQDESSPDAASPEQDR